MSQSATVGARPSTWLAARAVPGSAHRNARGARAGLAAASIASSSALSLPLPAERMLDPVQQMIEPAGRAAPSARRRPGSCSRIARRVLSRSARSRRPRRGACPTAASRPTPRRPGSACPGRAAPSPESLRPCPACPGASPASVCWITAGVPPRMWFFHSYGDRDVGTSHPHRSLALLRPVFRACARRRAGPHRMRRLRIHSRTTISEAHAEVAEHARVPRSGVPNIAVG